jgi:hypothetical protein
MNENRIYSNYIDTYGEEEGKQLYIQYLEFMSETTNFPTCLKYCEMIRKLKEEKLSIN